MENSNKQFRVLVATLNQAAIAAGTHVSTLADGALGLFSADTDLSVAATGTALASGKYYIAVGTTNADNELVQIRSAGQHIDAAAVTGKSSTVSTAAVQEVIEITSKDTTFATALVFYDTEYALNIVSRNGEILSDISPNEHRMRPTVLTPASPTGEIEKTYAYNSFAASLYSELKARERSDLFTVTARNTAGALADKAAIIASTTLAIITVTGGTVPMYDANKNINLRYFNNRVTTNEIFMSIDMRDVCTVTTTTAAVQAVGHGYDMRHLEDKCSGEMGAPGHYRQANSGLPTGNFDRLVSTTVSYNVYSLEYHTENSGGWQMYKEAFTTYLLVPTGNTTAITAALALMTKLGTLANTVTAVI